MSDGRFDARVLYALQRHMGELLEEARRLRRDCAGMLSRAQHLEDQADAAAKLLEMDGASIAPLAVIPSPSVVSAPPRVEEQTEETKTVTRNGETERHPTDPATALSD